MKLLRMQEIDKDEKIKKQINAVLIFGHFMLLTASQLAQSSHS